MIARVRELLGDAFLPELTFLHNHVVLDVTHAQVRTSQKPHIIVEIGAPDGRGIGRPRCILFFWRAQKARESFQIQVETFKKSGARARFD